MLNDGFNEEIRRVKAQYTMREIVERYGFRVGRSGFIPCPFHEGDNSPSLKVYKDSYYCFGCGEHGDIFSFVQKMDGVGFTDALISLGGVVQDKKSIDRQTRDRITRDRQQRIQDEKNHRYKIQSRWKQIEKHEEIMQEMQSRMATQEPLSDPWCESMDRYMLSFGLREILFEEVSSLSGNKHIDKG